MSDFFSRVKADLEKQYVSLQALVIWDPSVVSPKGTFNMVKVARFYETTPYHAEIMINGLKAHLDKYVDDNDFCHNIQWCFPKSKYNHLGYEE